jgi:hypothetical protein
MMGSVCSTTTNTDALPLPPSITKRSVVEESVYENSQTVINDLEKKGETQVKDLMTGKTSSVEDIGKSLMSIIENGANEYEKRTGQKMSYAEMRAAYG